MKSKSPFSIAKASAVLTLGFGLVAPCANAFEFNPSIGFDGGYSNLMFKDDFGHPIYKKNNNFFGPFVDLPIWECIGVEVGYQWFPKKSQVVRLNAGERTPSGNPVTIIPGEFGDVDSYRKLRAPYFAATATMAIPNYNSISIFGALGGSYVTLKAEEKVIATHLGPFTAAQTEGTRRTFDDSKMVLMAKIGANFKVNKHIGLRGFGEWKNTAALKVESNQTSATTGLRAQTKLKNTYMVGVGVFVTNFV